MNRKNKYHFTVISLFVVLNTTVHAITMHPDSRMVHANISIGLAYPQIPLSQFRPPIGITGTIGMQWFLQDRWALYISGNGLNTYSLGTVTGTKATLKYDVLWIAGNIQYRITSDFNKQNMLSTGLGLYKLHRQLDLDIDRVNTPGISLGFISNTFHRRFGGMFEIRWHLLFKPKDNPQILTVTYGILI